MRKLRLIRPWRLKAVRLRTLGERSAEIFETLPTQGPRAFDTMPMIARFTTVNFRACSNPRRTVAAPCSGIFELQSPR